jgi:hypothetical protein
MTTYRNLGGNSGVTFYQTNSDSIVVQFHDKSVYTYTYLSAGRETIEHMKALAAGGRGLNTFIVKRVKKLYASKHYAGGSSSFHQRY